MESTAGMNAMSDRERSYLQTSEEWVGFVSALVHELRTPLASFGMLADLLTESAGDRLGERERRYCENMREVARDIQSLIGEVAELARLLAGRATVRTEEAPLEPLLDQVESTVRSQAWERGVALTRALDPSLPRTLPTDPDRLRRLLALLMGLAVGRARSEVFWKLDLDGKALRVVISSDGPPIPDGLGDALFQPFGDQAMAARPRGGRSLALPLANELARVLGGTLRGENRGGRPAFDLSLPGAG